MKIIVWNSSQKKSKHLPNLMRFFCNFSVPVVTKLPWLKNFRKHKKIIVHDVIFVENVDRKRLGSFWNQNKQPNNNEFEQNMVIYECLPIAAIAIFTPLSLIPFKTPQKALFSVDFPHFFLWYVDKNVKRKRKYSATASGDNSALQILPKTAGNMKLFFNPGKSGLVVSGEILDSR